MTDLSDYDADVPAVAAAARAMLMALKRIKSRAHMKPDHMTIDVMNYAIKQAEEAGITTGEKDD